jgi:hypothetical protein
MFCALPMAAKIICPGSWVDDPLFPLLLQHHVIAGFHAKLKAHIFRQQDSAGIIDCRSHFTSTPRLPANTSDYRPPSRIRRAESTRVVLALTTAEQRHPTASFGALHGALLRRFWGPW